MPRQAEANLVALIESTDDRIWSVDLEYRLITFNRAARRGLEMAFGKQIAIGMRPDEFLPPAIAADWPPLYERALKDGPFRMEYRFAKNRFVELSLNPIVVDGKPAGISVFAKDITTQRATEESRSLLASIVESSEDAIHSVNLDGTVISWNCGAEALFGYMREEIIGKSIATLAPPGRGAEVPQLMGLIANGASVSPFNTVLRNKEGRDVDVSLSLSAIRDLAGNVVGASAIARDISASRKAEAALRESSESLREAQRIGGLGSYALELATGIWTSSEVLDELFGIDADFNRTLLAWMDLIHADDRDAVNAHVEEEVFGKRQEFNREYRIIRHNDGKERWVHGIGRVDYDAQGQPSKMHGIIKDITERKQVELQLRDSEARYRETFEQAAVGMAHAKFDGTLMRCNARYAEIIGYAPEEIPGLTIQQITAPEDLDKTLIHFKETGSAETGYSNWEKRYIRKDGSLAWVRVTTSIQRDSAGQPLHYIAVVEDINARKIAEERLAAAQRALKVSEERYRTAFQTSLDSIAINRLSDGMYIDCNKVFLDTNNYERDEVLGRTSVELGIWADSRDRRSFVSILRESSHCRDLEIRVRKKNGEVYWGLLSASLIELDGEICALTVVRDISDAKAAAEKIRNLAFYDPLTGLPNRRLLLDRVQQVLTQETLRKQKHALLLIDLDNFKTLNDTLGHQTGDMLLQEVAQRLTKCNLENETVARLVGDEFVVMLEGISETNEGAAQQANIRAEKVLSAIGQTYLIGGRECRCTASIGITIFGDGEEAADEILQQADIALDQSKADGSNTTRFFSPELQTAMNARAAMEEDLRQAITAEQFELYYQPQVEGAELIGVEALIRWNHPERGLLLPGNFIALAEETGLILPLGDWVLRTACRQLADWAQHPESAKLMVAVNISARQFRQPDFVEKVLRAVKQSGAAPERLELELTESMLAERIEEVIAKMTELKSHGLRFSLDDFGTGYSSLTYLKRLPLDQFKIDRSFVQDILADASSGAIAQTIISLSRAMGLPVIAEGVETEAQRDFLIHLGCHSFQGYLISRPLCLREFERRWMGHKESSAPISIEAHPHLGAAEKRRSIA